VLTGTATAGQEQNYLKLVAVTLPVANTRDTFGLKYDPDVEEIGGFGGAQKYVGLRVVQRMFHDGDVLKACYMPHNPNVLASSSSDGNIYLFDRSALSRTTKPNQPMRPLLPHIMAEPEGNERRGDFDRQVEARNRVLDTQNKWDDMTGAAQHHLVLNGNVGEAQALAWSTVAPGMLCAGSTGRVAVWSTASVTRGDVTDKTLAASRTLTVEGTVLDVAWSPSSENIVAVVTDRGHIYLVDVSADAPAPQPFHSPIGVVPSCVSWSTTTEHVFAVGCSDGFVHLYDSRATNGPTKKFQTHPSGCGVSTVQWCPHDSDILAAAGEDCDVVVANVAAQQILFVHGGHTAPVRDLCWSWQDAMAGQLLSVDAHVLAAWKPRNRFWQE
jgi:WD40 repeat protein